MEGFTFIDSFLYFGLPFRPLANVLIDEYLFYFPITAPYDLFNSLYVLMRIRDEYRSQVSLPTASYKGVWFDDGVADAL